MWFMSAAGLINTDWVISNVPLTLCINLPFCAIIYSSGCVNSKHMVRPITGGVPVFVRWHSRAVGFYMLSWQAGAGTSPMCVATLPWPSLPFTKDVHLITSH